MNRFILFSAAVLGVIAANAQFKSMETINTVDRPTVQLVKPDVKHDTMVMRAPGTPVLGSPRQGNDIKVWYRRPAGAFTSSLAVDSGAYAGLLLAPYLTVKPYSDYTFMGFAEGVSEHAQYFWEVQHYGVNQETSQQEQQWTTVAGKDLTWRWADEIDEVPTLHVLDNNVNSWWYLSGSTMSPQIKVADLYKANLLSTPSATEMLGFDLLKSSKTFAYDENTSQLMTYYIGALPYGHNNKGYWFGKNGGAKSHDGHTFHIDGIAQAFEKPEHPYCLNQVVMDCGVLNVTGPVDLYCNIYKLDEIPAYKDDDKVTLPDKPRELIARGRASLTPATNETTGGLVFFTLYDEDMGLEIEISPTIDCAILITVEDYNSPEMENLANFTAMIASNYNDDEGFGELAYLKLGEPDEENNLNHYEWVGLNNFFASGTMKTGLSIFLITELPYLTFNNNNENGEYTFPDKGGHMEKRIGSAHSIEFWSCVPSAEEGWDVTCNGGEIPSWLTIELEDEIKDGEFTGVVYADVTAAPLPKGETFREAIVRFSFIGAYIDYKFMQATPDVPPYEPFYVDVNNDGEVNIADVNALIELIHEGRYDTPVNFITLLNYILNQDKTPR